MSSGKIYHINPKTGNANICRAQLGKCPYEKDLADHYDTKDEAQQAYEKNMEEQVSKGTELLLKYTSTQRTILQMFNNNEIDENRDTLDYLVNRRKHIEKAIEDLAHYNTVDNFVMKNNEGKKKNSVTTRNYQQSNGHYHGFPNAVEGLEKTDPELLNSL